VDQDGLLLADGSLNGGAMSFAGEAIDRAFIEGALKRTCVLGGIGVQKEDTSLHCPGDQGSGLLPEALQDFVNLQGGGHPSRKPPLSFEALFVKSIPQPQSPLHIYSS
jgi:hypothetical protein